MKAIATAALALLAACGAPDARRSSQTPPASPAPDAALTGATPFTADPVEPHLTNLRQLTHGGENAEAYFSADGKQLIFQHTEPPATPCDQMFVMNLDGTNVRRVSNGQGRTTCGYFFAHDQRIFYASTYGSGPDCPAPPDRSRGYVWGLFDYDI